MKCSLYSDIFTKNVLGNKLSKVSLGSSKNCDRAFCKKTPKNSQQFQNSNICKKLHHRYLTGSTHAVFRGQVDKIILPIYEILPNSKLLVLNS